MKRVVARTLLRAGLCVATGRTLPVLAGHEPDFSSDEERDALLSYAYLEKMIPMVDAWARRTGLDLGPAPSRLSEVFRQITEAHYAELESLIEGLAKSSVSVKPALLKGGDLDLAVYPPDVPRSMADLDLLVRPTDVESVERALGAAGFTQGTFDRGELRILPADEAEKAAARDSGLELVEFAKIVHLPGLSTYRDEIRRYLSEPARQRLVILDRDVYSVIAFDLHINLSAGFDLTDSWWNFRTLQLPNGREMLAQSHSDLLWFLAARLYHEVLLHSRHAMRYFVDVCAVLARFGEQIDWHRVVAMGRKYKLHPSLYFVLHHADEILGSSVPGWVIEAFDLRRDDADRSHDWGDFAPKMLGELVIQPLFSKGLAGHAS